MSNKRPTLAFIGGTGDLGSGLAWRFATAGYPIVIGSRTVEKAAEAAAKLNPDNTLAISGASNENAAIEGDIVFLTVPFASHETTLVSIRTAVQGKIVVDSTVPLVPPKVVRVQLPAGGCAAKQTQDFLGDGVRVVSAFHNVAAAHMRSSQKQLKDCDVLVTGNDADARAIIVDLAETIGFKAWHAGGIDNSAVAEALTSVLIFLNRHYGISGAGIVITGHPTKAK
ncbi:MAG: NADPH-dependent F420 reductase [Afipia sp. 64-13]|nr:MAG: NADPH-dependent F420 reductase [Afipia sp. 64-13]